MVLIDDIKTSQILLLTTTKNQYNESMNAALPDIEKASNKIGYITINKPFNTVIQSINQKGLNKEIFHFVDAITATVQTPPTAHNCIFVSSPSALTESCWPFPFSPRGC